MFRCGEAGLTRGTGDRSGHIMDAPETTLAWGNSTAVRTPKS
jgi:hypothetical protein